VTVASVTALICALVPASARASEVADWNRQLQQSILAANTSPLATNRILAIVQVAVFDAVNGIERRYTPVHVDFDAPPGASPRAAVVQAAYATLVRLFPAQANALAVRREASLAAISSQEGAEHSQSIIQGIEWGQQVADDILLWRSTDGLTPTPPPFLGGTNVGQWRPTPPGFAPGAGPQFAYMTPWAMSAPSQFRPSGPPLLSSAQYARDVAEVQEIGSSASGVRTADQTQIAVFWTANTAVSWNRLATSIAEQRHLTLSESARILAQLNVAMTDATIACWEAKYHYVFWRPITAIRLADTDPNPGTVAEPSWTPLLVTPAHPEYPAGHSTVSGAAATVLALLFGDEVPFALESEALPGVTRYYGHFSEAADEANNARVYGGMHFLSAVVDGRAMGDAIGAFVIAHVAQPGHGVRMGQTSHVHPQGGGW
jgi:membrane-associated phospholipid phosphatase